MINKENTGFEIAKLHVSKLFKYRFGKHLFMQQVF